MTRATDLIKRMQKGKNNYIKTQGLATSEPQIIPTVSEKKKSWKDPFLDIKNSRGRIKNLIKQAGISEQLTGQDLIDENLNNLESNDPINEIQSDIKNEDVS